MRRTAALGQAAPPRVHSMSPLTGSTREVRRGRTLPPPRVPASIRARDPHRMPFRPAVEIVFTFSHFILGFRRRWGSLRPSRLRFTRQPRLEATDSPPEVARTRGAKPPASAHRDTNRFL